jgi:hypothetical protein
MKRVVILTLLALTLSAQTNVDTEFSQNMVKFQAAYVKFMMAYWACPEWADSFKDCHPDRGLFDTRAFKESRELAKKLYDLKEPKTK